MQRISKNLLRGSQAIIQSLAHGLDPETGHELPKDSIVNRIEVNRALSTSLLALEQMDARLARRSQLPDSVGKKWTEEETQRLKDEFNSDEAIPVIATKHARTVRAIEARLVVLGLLTAAQPAINSSFLENRRSRGKDGE